MSGQQAVASGSLDVARISTIDPLDESDTAVFAALGAEHSAWPVDSIILTPRARAFIATMVRIFIPILGYWDQSIRSLKLTAGEIILDAAGVYRCLR